MEKMEDRGHLIKSQMTGSNAGRSRAYNRGLVLSHVRTAGRCGRAEIARASGLSTQAVSNIIAELQAEGFLRETGFRAGGRGLPAMQYEIEPIGGFAVGVELRPNAIRAAILDLSGKALWTGRVSLTDASPRPLLSALRKLLKAGISKAEIDEARILGAGVVLPGPFGKTGLSDAATELPGWTGHDRQTLIADALQFPTLIENDANAAAVAERISGAARGLSHYAFVYFGTGLGLGIVSDSALMRGAFGNAGELGHLRIGGNRLEDIASRLALSRRIVAAGMPAATVWDLAKPNTAPIVQKWASQAGPALGEAVVILENLFDPQTIIFGGALPDSVLDLLIAQVPLADKSLSHRADRILPRICRGGAGRMTATLGAGALVIDRLFTASLDPL